MEGEQVTEPRSVLVDDAGEAENPSLEGLSTGGPLQAEPREREGISYANVSK